MTYRDRPVQCPRCGIELERDDTRDLWPCGRCKGLLAGVGEVVRKLVQLAPDLVPDGGVGGLPTLGRRTAAPLLPCPVCGADMEPVFLGGVELDRCFHDELVWFDRGEYDLVIDVAADQRDQREESWLRKVFRQWFGDSW